ncbi:5762_t:CDS:10 [Acaulospora morrowiae]|uniref:Microtubule-associated protein n=1 Tax=Acaulospora morrowiae TaxID=94023 RepID=A0A9N9CKI9_9GLOM|nr:5762_t:CDS:10 [Acaulospora morrowiae]
MNSTSNTSGAGIPILTFSDRNYVLPLTIIASIAIGSILLHLLLIFLLRKVSQRTGWIFDAEVVKHCSKPTFFMFPLSSVFITLYYVTADQSIIDTIRHTLQVLIIFFTTWTAIGLIKAWTVTMKDSKNKKLQTQLVVSSRIAYGFTSFFGTACILLTFPSARELGASLLASASVVAVLVGFAAKSSLEAIMGRPSSHSDKTNLIASLQIALTQPLILGDWVVIDNCQGIVEEIQPQFIVIKTIEEKRLIVPLSRVVNQSFENWSRNGESKTPCFYLCVDYGIPLKDLRQQFMSMLHKCEYWDQRNALLNIDEAKENVLVLKVMMTASNVKNSEKLKLEIREKLIEYIMITYPQYLPRVRSEGVPSRKGVDSMKKVIAKMEEATTRTTQNDNKKLLFGAPRNYDDEHTPIRKIQKDSTLNTPPKLSKLPVTPLTTVTASKIVNNAKIDLTRPPLVRSHSAKESISSDDTLSSNGKKSSRASPNIKSTVKMDFSHVKSRIGSLENISHKPKESEKKIFSEKPDFAKVSSRVGSLDNINHTPKSKETKIFSEKPNFSKVHSRVGSLDNVSHTPKGGKVKIYSNKPNFSHVTSRVGSLDNIDHVPGGGEKYVPINPIKIPKAEVKSKIGSFDNIKHTPRGGEVKIFNQKPNFRDNATPKIKIRTRSNSIASSGSSAVDEDVDRKSLFCSPVSPFTLDDEIDGPPSEQTIPAIFPSAASLISTKREHYIIEEEVDEVDGNEPEHMVNGEEESCKEGHEKEQEECEDEYEDAIPVVLSNDNISGDDISTTGVNSQLNDVELSFEVNVSRKSVLLANHVERNTIIELQPTALPKRLSAIEIPPQTDEVLHESQLTLTQKQAYDESWI